MARATRPAAARPTKVFKLASCTAAAFKPAIVGRAEALVEVGTVILIATVKVEPYKFTKQEKNVSMFLESN